MPHEPKKKHSKAVKRTRRAAIKLASVRLLICPNCNSKTLAHMACRNCGFYAGKQIGKEQVKVTRAS
ncbi:50S ribosomal protein L32 [Candidatus Daviesbacteria bacterium RIFCSPHIGHO2_01_FULL_36_37]|uniref:Large ribosomal subunit protein bL32 n=2 Tax=Candidatus Daviesiibacteriota TaxID=1752718 RepID=A0A1F5K4V0_9BACT|nr:MAG: 50S ribosomal protein L32 [Candidatus Daviesbacteria bacterium RIFCSPHIGHO2_01_FULL_36_37]OGE35993.1 MAG: 50S ribosomal protein L32 [Candidatus Daviesbacteria bacterium RIFCSPHIGHO2_12_FULL_37_16]